MIFRFWLRGAIQTSKGWFWSAPRKRKPRRRGIASPGIGRNMGHMIRTITNPTMNTERLHQLQDQGLTASQIDAIAGSEEAMARRHDDAIERRQQLAKDQALEEQRWAREQAWRRQQDATDSAQARRARR